MECDVIKILVPIDGSGHSERIIAELLKIAELYKGPVLLHVLNVQPPVPYANKVSHAIGHEVVDGYLQEQGELALKPSLAALTAAGLTYVPHIKTGETADVILRVAEETGCTQIFMGTHGRGAISGLVLGSVATKVVHLAAIPVTLVRQ
jgi:nucleotide-binding universal stress UspA family protein